MITNLKRYLVFAGDKYYPRGGWVDFIDSFDDKDAAVQRAVNGTSYGSHYDWWHVTDSKTGEIVEECL